MAMLCHHSFYFSSIIPLSSIILLSYSPLLLSSYPPLLLSSPLFISGMKKDAFFFL
jgi:hypothetical protein